MAELDVSGLKASVPTLSKPSAPPLLWMQVLPQSGPESARWHACVLTTAAWRGPDVLRLAKRWLCRNDLKGFDIL
jgi:hypothetical protein